MVHRHESEFLDNNAYIQALHVNTTLNNPLILALFQIIVFSF